MVDIELRKWAMAEARMVVMSWGGGTEDVINAAATIYDWVTQTSDLKLYDISIDDLRPVVQADVDNMQTWIQAYGKLRQFVKGAEEVHQEALASLTARADA